MAIGSWKLLRGVGGRCVDRELAVGRKLGSAAEPELFDTFDFTWLTGSASDLKYPNTVVLSASVADQFFGSWQRAMGQRIEMWSFRIPLRVVGIYQDRSIIDYRIPIVADAVLRRDVIVGDPCFRKDCSHPNIPFIAVRWPVFFHHVMMEAGTLVHTQDPRHAAGPRGVRDRSR